MPPGIPTPPVPDSPEPAARHIARFARRRGSGATNLAFGARLVLALVITFAAVGFVGYSLVADQLVRSQIASYATIQKADVRSLEAIGRTASRTHTAVRRINELLRAIDNRPGTVETLLIDQHNIVRAAGNGRGLVGSSDADPKIDAALKHGASYAGTETNPRADPNNFEFVAPVHLPDGRYVLEAGYDHNFLDANLGDVRQTLALIGLLALFGGSGVFYLVGGRSLMRSHRVALDRATRDGLTDLPNHRAFQDELVQAVSAATRHHQPLGLAIFDLDDFKFHNDRHGHVRGDELLKHVAAVLSKGRVENRAYRIGGDEFAVLLPHTDLEGARTFAQRLSRSLTASESIVSVGVSDLRGGQSSDGLRAEADAALYEAKRAGGHRVMHFDDIRDDVAITTSDKTDAVRRLIDEGHLETFFQPIWDLDSGTLLGVEALARPDSEYGFSGPAEAFDLAEQIGRVHVLDVLCVENALQVAHELPDDALLFLNLSPLTLDLDAKGNDWFREAVERAGLPTDRVVIEVTERFGGRTASIVKSLQRLREQGFKLALDDVGTGNSGLEMLRQVDAEYVKIDRSIVLAATLEPNARAVLMAMATYARQTGSFVIAEGIEDQETLDFLRTIDERDVRLDRIIQGGQGYALGRPGPHVIDEQPGILPRASSRQPAGRVPAA
jgi:diguanylate cyclase (GGDEF)-like protein